MAKTVVGFFENPSDAQGAMRDLESAGFSGANTSFVHNASDHLSGVFEQLGVPQDEAHLYLEGVRNGGAIVVLQQLSDDDSSRAADILDRHHVVDIDSLRGRYARSQTATTATSASTQTAERGTTAATG